MSQDGGYAKLVRQLLRRSAPSDTPRTYTDKMAIEDRQAAEAIKALVVQRDEQYAALSRRDNEVKLIRGELLQATQALAPLDAIVHALGIEDSDDDPVEVIKKLIHTVGNDSMRICLLIEDHAALVKAAQAFQRNTDEEIGDQFRHIHMVVTLGELRALDRALNGEPC